MLSLKNILICTDFSENADFAFDFALNLAGHYPGSVLHVLHVLPEPAAQFWRGYINEVDNVEDKAREEINALFASYKNRAPAGCELQAVVRFGKPGEEILAYAKSVSSDMIVVGRQGRGAIFFGNTAAHVAKSAACPVLVLPLDFKKLKGWTP